MFDKNYHPCQAQEQYPEPAHNQEERTEAHRVSETLGQ